MNTFFIRACTACFCMMNVLFNFSYGQSDTSKLTEPELSLKELLKVKVTTASKTSVESEMAPATVLVISQEQIRMRNYQSLLDVMYDLPDVKVDDKIYSGIRNGFTVRGTQGQDKFLILLDGIPVSSPSGEAMPIMENYPVNLAEQIEIVYGPASALYGADAVSGVINIISRKSPGKKQTIAEASSLAGSYGYTNNTLFIAQKLSDQISLVVSGQYSYDQQPDYSSLNKKDSLLSIDSYSSGTLNTIYGPMTPKKPFTSKYEAPIEAYNILAALHAGDFSFTYFRNYSKIPTSWGNNTSNAIYNKDVSMAQSVDMANVTYKKTFDRITSTTSMTSSEYNLDPQSNYRNLYTNMEPAYKYSTCTKIKGEEQLDWKVSQQLGLIAGASYETYNSVPQSTDLEAPVNPDAYLHGSYLGTSSYYRPEGLAAQFYILKYHNVGTYLQAQYSPVSKLNITLGARYDINSRYGSSFNPRLGIVYKPFNRTTIKALYGTAFLAPTPSDCYVQYGSFDSPDSGKTFHSYFLHLPNPGLKPITSENFELNIRQYLSENLSVTADAYLTNLTNLHAFADDNETTHLYNNQFNGIAVDYIEVFINQSRQTNYGGSLQLNWKHRIGRFHLNSYVASSYVDGKIDNAPDESKETTPDLETEFISHLVMHVGTDVKIGKFSFSPRLIFLTSQHISGISDTTGTVSERQSIPGYALLNISLRYNVTKRFSAFANVSNALNQTYRSAGFNMDLNDKNTSGVYGQPQDPIRVMGGISLSF